MGRLYPYCRLNADAISTDRYWPLSKYSPEPTYFPDNLWLRAAKQEASFPWNFIIQRGVKLQLLFGRKTIKIAKQEYMAAFKELVVKRVKVGQTSGAIAKESIEDWISPQYDGKLVA